jgi:hypothetical protein
MGKDIDISKLKRKIKFHFRTISRWRLRKNLEKCGWNRRKEVKDEG